MHIVDTRIGQAYFAMAKGTPRRVLENLEGGLRYSTAAAAAAALES